MPNYTDFLNPNRPLVFCPGCSHERNLKSLEKSFKQMRLDKNEIVMVTDIGCSGLFDTYFNTHAMHGLHGRALTYAAGIKMARPNLKVIVIMGDGGVGIGGAHLLEACRRNLDLTLIILNNFNFGMTGGQFSCTTPTQANSASGFLNSLEVPLDICRIAESAGASFIVRASSYDENIADLMSQAVTFDGFALMDIWSLCPGRYGRKNRISVDDMESRLNSLPTFNGPVQSNIRPEYAGVYRKNCGKHSAGVEKRKITPIIMHPADRRREILILGSAGESVISAGSILAHAAILGGMHVAQKSEYNVTVMRGPSVTEIIMSPKPITYAGIIQADVIIALSQEAVEKHIEAFKQMKTNGLVIQSKGVTIPKSRGKIQEVDFGACGIKNKERALASLSILAESSVSITSEMLKRAVLQRYPEKKTQDMLAVIRKASNFKLVSSTPTSMSFN